MTEHAEAHNGEHKEVPKEKHKEKPKEKNAESHGPAQWTDKQQNDFTALYKKLESMPGYNQEKTYHDLFSEQLPYKEAKSKLMHLMESSSHSEGGLEKAMHEIPDKHSRHVGGHSEKNGGHSEKKSKVPSYVAPLLKTAAMVAGMYTGINFLL